MCRDRESDAGMFGCAIPRVSSKCQGESKRRMGIVARDMYNVCVHELYLTQCDKIQQSTK